MVQPRCGASPVHSAPMPRKPSPTEQLAQRVRNVRRKAANRKCFDCSSSSPPYVCLDFSTFVCMSCSGLHREFNRKVKSISASVFTEDEVEAIENGGNDVAAALWLASHSEDDFRTPTAVELHRIKQFMVLKYERREYVKKSRRSSPETKSSRATSRHKSSKATKKKKKRQPVVVSSDDEPEVETREFAVEFPDLSMIINTGFQESPTNKAPELQEEEAWGFEESPKAEKKSRKSKKLSRKRSEKRRGRQRESSKSKIEVQEPEEDLFDLQALADAVPREAAPEPDSLLDFDSFLPQTQPSVATDNQPQTIPKQTAADPFADLFAPQTSTQTASPGFFGGH